MSANHSPLMPTTIVDRNGVITSRNKKSTAPPGKKLALPPVNLTASSRASSDDDEALRDLMFGEYGGENGREGIALLREDDPETITLAIDALSNAVEPAQILVRRTLNDLFDQLSGVRMRLAPGEDWKAVCSNILSPSIKDKIVQAVDAGNLIFETGSTVRPMDLKSLVDSLDYSLRRWGRVRREPSTESAYWRGLTIIGLSKIRFVNEVREDAPDFIAWAGTHSDPAGIVRLIQERGTLHAETLQAVLSEQNQTAAGLREGVL